jgi:hypothetical protein
MKHLVIFYGFLYFGVFRILHLRNFFRKTIDYGSVWPKLLIELCRYHDQSAALISKKECVSIPIYLFLQ